MEGNFHAWFLMYSLKLTVPLSGFRLMYCQMLVISDIYRISVGPECVNQPDAHTYEVSGIIYLTRGHD